MLLPITQAIIFQRQEGAVPPWTNLVQVFKVETLGLVGESGCGSRLRGAHPAALPRHRR